MATETQTFATIKSVQEDLTDEIILKIIKDYARKCPTFASRNIAKIIINKTSLHRADFRAVSQRVALFCIQCKSIRVAAENNSHKRYSLLH
ncbi:MAG: hypothetical protein GF353_28630 [Candidatus Lokiarchaeota archaeon]|nr:hypothetical protein [Candidatus Lokiarchaeota archaeon]MBD3353969.1 hypothetical protein [Candidatus Lokiarchaeota archaeon]